MVTSFQRRRISTGQKTTKPGAVPFPQMQLIRAHSPLVLDRGTSQNPNSVLKALSAAAESVAEMLQPDSDATVRAILKHATTTGLLALDERFK